MNRFEVNVNEYQGINRLRRYNDQIAQIMGINVRVLDIDALRVVSYPDRIPSDLLSKRTPDDLADYAIYPEDIQW